MSAFKIFKETSLPSSFVPNAMYLIAAAEDPNYLELFVTDKDGLAARSTLGIPKVQALIEEYMETYEGGTTPTGTVQPFHVVDTIAERDALELTANTFVFVTDATGDSTVNAGAASYAYRASTSTFTKVSEHESLDLVLSWENIVGRPNVTVEQIEDAVTMAHSHINMEHLNKIGQDVDGNMTYNNQLPTTGLSTVNW